MEKPADQSKEAKNNPCIALESRQKLANVAYSWPVPHRILFRGSLFLWMEA